MASGLTAAVGASDVAHRTPACDRASAHEGRGDWIALALLCVPILGASLVSRFGVPGFAQLGIGIALPMMLLAFAAGALSGRVQIEPGRLALFCLMLATLTLPQLLRAGPFSASSLLMLAVVHLPYVLLVAGGREHVQRVLSFFLAIATLLAVCAIAQYFLQSALDIALLFPIDHFVPAQFVVQGFNSQGLIHYGASVYRANGVFMLEPSFLTQFLAVAIIAEAATRRTLLRIGLYALGIVVAHAGTGLLILLVCLPWVISAHRRWDLLILACLAALALVAAADILNLDMIANRADEFSDPKSSGYARFVGGFHLFEQMLWPDPVRAAFGYGAGAFMEHAHLFRREVADMPLTKMVFEFGVVGAAMYFAFVMSCLFRSPLPRVVSVAIALTFLLNGIYVPFSHGLALGLLVLSSRPALPFAQRDSRPASHYQVRPA
jgi:hypothetical protein